MLKIVIARVRGICIITVQEKPNVKASKMNNFALDQIIAFLHYITSKEMKGSN